MRYKLSGLLDYLFTGMYPLNLPDQDPIDQFGRHYTGHSILGIGQDLARPHHRILPLGHTSIGSDLRIPFHRHSHFHRTLICPGSAAGLLNTPLAPTHLSCPVFPRLKQQCQLH